MFLCENVEKILRVLGVADCEIPKPIDTELLELVRQDINKYIELQMGAEPYVFNLFLPNDEKKVFESKEINYTMYPFMAISDNVWDFLVSNNDNPVFRLLRYFSDNIEYLKLLMNKYGVDELTADIPVWDRFNLSKCFELYENVQEVIG